MRSAAEFVATPRAAYDVPILLEGLEIAAAIELATLPPYLCGFWSIVQNEDPDGVATSIATVFRQEMLHLGLVCNMTTAIGGTPNLLPPGYPGPLPAGLRPGLVVTLQGLTLDYVTDVYMQIEYPEDGPVTGDSSTPTIGTFYDVLAVMFQLVDPPFVGGTQQTASIGGDQLTTITSLTEALAAITVIKEQGEGTATSPDAVDTGDPTDLAHYYRFGEIANGRRIVQVGGAWEYAGDPVRFPATLPMAPVPLGGWTDVAPDVAKTLEAFSSTYAELLAGLNAAWSPTGTPDDLNGAIGAMFQLGAPATALMEIPIPGGTGTYGPDWIVR